MINMEKKNGKVYIEVKDEDSREEWTVEVSEAEFEWCVKQKERLGFNDPEGSAMIDYAYSQHCFVPKPVSAKERARRLFDMVMDELQFADSKYETLEALRDMIDNWLLDYRLSGGEKE
jgi:hypothetical protein